MHSLHFIVQPPDEDVIPENTGDKRIVFLFVPTNRVKTRARTRNSTNV